MDSEEHSEAARRLCKLRGINIGDDLGDHSIINQGIYLHALSEVLIFNEVYEAVLGSKEKKEKGILKRIMRAKPWRSS